MRRNGFDPCFKCPKRNIVPRDSDAKGPIDKSIGTNISTRSNFDKGKEMKQTRFIFILTLFCCTQIAIAMDPPPSPKKEYPIKSVLIPFLAYDQYFSLGQLKAEGSFANLEDRVINQGLLSEDILAYPHMALLVFHEKKYPCGEIIIKQFMQRDVLQMITASIWCDIKHGENCSELSLKAMAKKDNILEIYDFIKLWLLENQEIKKEYNIFLANTSKNCCSVFGIPLDGFPQLLKLTSFLPHKENVVSTDPTCQIPLSIINTPEYMALIRALKDKNSCDQFCASVEEVVLLVAQQLDRDGFIHFVASLFSTKKAAIKKSRRNCLIF